MEHAMAPGETAVRAAFTQQARWCRELGSPLTGLLMEVLATRLDRSTVLGRRILDWQGTPDARFDALPLRLAGGLHGMVRAGLLPALAACYPPHERPHAGALWAAVSPALAHAALGPWLDSAPQTNEVARSGVLYPGLMVVAQETGLPLSLFELGASAGLNLLPDRYAYRLGDVEAGVPGSPVRLTPEWRGVAPQHAPVRIVARRGVDLRPVDVTRPDEVARVMAYIWPDQAERLALARAAFALAAATPPPIDRGDAADWTEARLPPAPEEGVARVLMHSIAFQYFPSAVQERVAARAGAVGARATAAGPFAWMRYEVHPHHGGRPALSLTVWPGGRDRVLALGNPHGKWVEWLAPSEPT